MLSKNKIKYIQSLSRKKVREKEKAFLVEGDKLVLEALQSNFEISLICCTEEFSKNNNISNDSSHELIIAKPDEIQKASLLKSPQEALAVVKKPDYDLQLPNLIDELSIALDFIQDPGNLGTIIRIADWFGIKHILCSENTVDCFNPKVIQASMGSIFRVMVHYVDLPKTLNELSKNGLPVYGTFLEGNNIFTSKLTEKGLLVMGNEGNGISPEVEKSVTQKIHIPSSNEQGSESLNVATATAIICAEFRRRSM